MRPVTAAHVGDTNAGPRHAGSNVGFRFGRYAQ
ncbi:hypothetical protein J2Z79_002534 [Symbiobacterium terraclitae]|uniref:Uncharacterized protein n=1 Tax=Symbiobacterium terraclitae TaxID=557451 RepID=A0ABS4JU99_9FIRM|nr:hypothetical protein [Symbiobacterium terraclitae]